MKKATVFLYAFGSVFVSSIAGLLFGFDLVVISGALSFIAKEFYIVPDQLVLKELIISAVPAGALLGALFSAYFGQIIGRKYSIVLTAIIFSIGTLVVVYAWSVDTIIIGRIIKGFAVGLSATVVPIYLAEISTPKMRGTLVFLYQLAITLGIALGFFINHVFHENCGWREMFFVAIIPSLLLCLGMMLLPESPSWLISRNRLEAAKRSLRKLKGVANNDLEIKKIKNLLNYGKGSFFLLFSKNLRPLALVSISLFLFQQLTGINSIFYYAPTIFDAAGITNSTIASMSTGSIFVFATVIGVFLIDRVGRRILLLVGTFGIATCQFLQGVALQQYFPINVCALISIISALIAISFYAFSITGIAYIIMSEIFPLSIRSYGTSLASCANWGMNMVVAATFLSLNSIMGIGGTFLLYAFITFLGFIFIYYFVPETKGVALEHIEEKIYAGVRVRYLGRS